MSDQLLVTTEIIGLDGAGVVFAYMHACAFVEEPTPPPPFPLTTLALVRIAALFKEAADVLIGAGSAPDTAAKAFFVPGRIEVMGKHTDYAGGRSLLGAVSKGFCVVAVSLLCFFFVEL